MFLQYSFHVVATNWWPGGGDGAEAPELRPGLREEDITPGILGFLFTALMAFLLIVVVRDMIKRMRRMKYLSRVENERAAQSETADSDLEFPGEVVSADSDLEFPGEVVSAEAGKDEKVSTDHDPAPQPASRESSAEQQTSAQTSSAQLDAQRAAAAARFRSDQSN